MGWEKITLGNLESRRKAKETMGERLVSQCCGDTKEKTRRLHKNYT